jgi:hypothetical protein
MSSLQSPSDAGDSGVQYPGRIAGLHERDPDQFDHVSDLQHFIERDCPILSIMSWPPPLS